MKTLTLVFVFVLLSLTLAGTLVKLGTANPAVPTTVIQILSPGYNKTYPVDRVILKFAVAEYPYSGPQRYPTGPLLIGTPLIQYYLDEEVAGQFDAPEFDGRELSKTFSISLTNLLDGEHSVEVNKTAVWRRLLGDYRYIISSGKVHFTVDTTPPSISILSPENKTYSTSEVPLDFIVNDSTVARIAYSLDGQERLTSSEDTKLTGLSSGAHNVTVYAWDEAGNGGKSKTVYFIVSQEIEVTQPSNPELFPTTLVAVSVVVIVAVVSFGLVAYSLRRKGKKSEA